MCVQKVMRMKLDLCFCCHEWWRGCEALLKACAIRMLVAGTGLNVESLLSRWVWAGFDPALTGVKSLDQSLKRRIGVREIRGDQREEGKGPEVWLWRERGVVWERGNAEKGSNSNMVCGGSGYSSLSLFCLSCFYLCACHLVTRC